MRICVAQTRPVKGDIRANIEKHKKLIELAVSNRSDTIIFPELSITGYEPELAKDLATTSDDSRFDVFQKISDDSKIMIGVGMPTKSDSGIRISMLIFQPGMPRQIYSKQHLHVDEEPYFVYGKGQTLLMQNGHKIALAICYELSVPEHAENAYKQRADVYVASVAKTAEGVKKAADHLSNIANTYLMTVLMTNCVGYCDNFEGAGKSSIWNNKGVLVGQLNGTDEGILILDTDTQELIETAL